MLLWMVREFSAVERMKPIEEPKVLTMEPLGGPKQTFILMESGGGGKGKQRTGAGAGREVGGGEK